MPERDIVAEAEAGMLPLTKKVFTKVYFPFTMGGSTQRFVATKVPVDGPYHIAKGFYVYKVISPRGQVFWAEMKSGAFLGKDFESIRYDIESCVDRVFMEKQVEDALEYARKAKLVPPKEFWGRIKMAHER